MVLGLLPAYSQAAKVSGTRRDQDQQAGQILMFSRINTSQLVFVSLSEMKNSETGRHIPVEVFGVVLGHLLDSGEDTCYSGRGRMSLSRHPRSPSCLPAMELDSIPSHVLRRSPAVSESWTRRASRPVQAREAGRQPQQYSTPVGMPLFTACQPMPIGVLMMYGRGRRRVSVMDYHGYRLHCRVAETPGRPCLIL